MINNEIQPTMICSCKLTAQMRKRLYWVGRLVGGQYEQVIINQPEDKGIALKDILESGDTERLRSYCITATYSRACPEDYFNHGQRQLIFKSSVQIGKLGKGGQGNRVYHSSGKSICLSASSGGIGGKTGLYEIKGCAMRGRNIVDGKRKDILGSKTEQRLEFRNDDKINCLTTVSKDSLVAVKDIVRKLTPIECERLQGYPDNYTEGISNSQRYKALGNSFTVPAIKHILNHIY